MKIGFTGSRKGTELAKVKEVLDSLNLTRRDTIVTGACVGIDAQVSKLALERNINQVIIVPFNRKNVPESIITGPSEDDDYIKIKKIIGEICG